MLEINVHSMKPSTFLNEIALRFIAGEVCGLGRTPGPQNSAHLNAETFRVTDPLLGRLHLGSMFERSLIPSPRSFASVWM